MSDELNDVIKRQKCGVFVSDFMGCCELALT